MNRNLLTLLLALCCYFQVSRAIAQDNKTGFGTVTEADLKMNACSIDTSAPAFVVFDQGEISFAPAEGNFDVVYTRQMRIKILKKSGIRFSEMSIPLYFSNKGDHPRDDFRELKAFTYNLAGGKITKTKVDPKTVYEQKATDYLMIKKIAFPDVHEGSVLEIRYEIRSPFKFRLHSWVFQRHIPVIYSECVLKYTPFFLYTYLLKNADKFDEYKEYQQEGLDKEFYGTSYKEGICRFVMKNLPAYTETEFISSEEDNLITLRFQMNKFTNTRGVSENQCSTWDELAKLLKDDSDFGKYVTSCQSVARQILDDNKIMALPLADRFNAIVSWVKTNLSWNEYHRVYAEIKPKELLKRKSGNSAEINLFLCGMLNEAGLEAWPVLISTHGNGKVIRDYPFMDFFNYVIVAVKTGEKWVLTDATEPLCENGTFPPRCINGKGLLVKGEKTLWVDLAPKGLSSVENRIRLRFKQGADSLEARFTTMARGYNALRFRRIYGHDPVEARKYFSEKGIEAGDSLVISNAGADSLMKPCILSMNSIIPVEISDKMLVIEPFCGLAIRKNPFDKPTRKFPVDLVYPENVTLVMELVVPEGYRIKQLPESFSWDHDQMSFSFVTQATGDKIMCHAFYSVKNAVFAPEEYLKLQLYFADIVKKLNEKIFLEKIS